MKRKIKKCKGLSKGVCIICKRQDDKEPEALVKDFAIDPDNGRETCNHFIR